MQMPSNQPPADEELATRKKLTFAQAEGAEDLPTQLKRGEITAKGRAYLWAMVWNSLKDSFRHREFAGQYVDEPWRSILAAKHTFRDFKPADEFDNSADKLTSDLKKAYMDGTCIEVLDLTQWILRRGSCPNDLSEAVKIALERSHSAYTVIDGDTIMPVSSPEESAAVADAIRIARAIGVAGPRQHLKQAAQYLSSGKWPDSIRESIHAVEAAARTIEPGSNELSPTLTALEKKGKIHAAMKMGFQKLYGFTSNEEGIRHSLLDKTEAEVDQADAQYMLGACAAFVSYLLTRAREGR